MNICLFLILLSFIMMGISFYLGYFKKNKNESICPIKPDRELSDEELQRLADEINKKCHNVAIAEQKAEELNIQPVLLQILFDKDGDKHIYLDNYELNTKSLTLGQWVTDEKLAKVAQLLKEGKPV